MLALSLSTQPFRNKQIQFDQSRGMFCRKCRKKRNVAFIRTTLPETAIRNTAASESSSGCKANFGAGLSWFESQNNCTSIEDLYSYKHSHRSRSPHRGIDGNRMLWLCNSFPSSIWVWLHWAKGTKNSSTSLWRRAMMQILGRSAGSDREYSNSHTSCCWCPKIIKSFTKSAKSSTNLPPNHHISQEEAQPISVLQEENQQLRQQLQVGYRGL